MDECDALRVTSFFCPLIGSLSFLRVTTIAIAVAREMLRDTPLSNDARTAERAGGHKILRDACIRESDDVAARSKTNNAGTIDTRLSDEIGSERTDRVFVS